MEPDVLIVGGGIGGAVLALALGRQGWRVRVLEREPSQPRPARPEILYEPTLMALDRLGIGDRLRDEATLPIRRAEIRDHDRLLLTLDASIFDAVPDSRPYSADPARVREIIMQAALRTGGVELVCGAIVSDVSREGERIAGVRGRREGQAFEERARLLVGNDGIRSIVRGAIGPPIRLRLFPAEYLTFVVPRPADAPTDLARGWLAAEALRGGIAGALFLPLPDSRTAVALALPMGTWEARFRDRPDAFWSAFAALVPGADKLREHLPPPDELNRVRRAYGHAPRYVADGAALIGDAAHPMSPAGGQGANAAIWDALALAEVADEALRAGDVSVTRLLPYERRRRPANARSLWYTRRAVTLVRLARRSPACGGLLLGLARQANRSVAVKRDLLRRLSTSYIDRPAPS